MFKIFIILLIIYILWFSLAIASQEPFNNIIKVIQTGDEIRRNFY